MSRDAPSPNVISNLLARIHHDWPYPPRFTRLLRLLRGILWPQFSLQIHGERSIPSSLAPSRSQSESALTRRRPRNSHLRRSCDAKMRPSDGLPLIRVGGGKLKPAGLPCPCSARVLRQHRGGGQLSASFTGNGPAVAMASGFWLRIIGCSPPGAVPCSIKSAEEFIVPTRAS